MSAPRVTRVVAAVLAGAALCLVGCQRGSAEDHDGACACADAPVVDPVLLAFLSKARAAHHDADLAEEKSDRAAAIAVLDRLAIGPRPGGAAPPPEVREVLADTRARLADLRSAEEQFEPALADVEAGLALATEPTHFRGHLLEMRGIVEQRRAKSLAESGDTAGAERARNAAMDDFQRAIDVQDEVIARSLGDAGAP